MAQMSMRYGLQEINGIMYYFDTWNGAMTIGLVTDTNGKTVYIESNGKQALGEKKDRK